MQKFYGFKTHFEKSFGYLLLKEISKNSVQKK